MKKKKLLIIGTAQRQFIHDCIAESDRKTTDIHLLVPERDRNAFGSEAVTYFKGSLHAFFPPLLKTISTFKPDEAVIVCGMTYDHDNVVKAVSFYEHFYRLKTLVSIRNRNYPADPDLKPVLFREIFECLSLGLTALLVKSASLFKTIRIGEIYSSRLGHLALDSEIYLSEKELGRHDDTLDLFCFKDGQTANRTLGTLFCREMNISDRNGYLLQAIRRFNMAEEHEIKLNTRKISLGRDYDCVMRQTDKHISFTSGEQEKGRKEIALWGLDPEKELVCLLGRDSAFLKESVPGINDGDMQQPRNMQISTFKAGAEYLLDQGYSVVRIGCTVTEPLEIDHPDFMDYPNSGKRSDFMDIYLPATCSFFVGVQSGPQQVANIFRVPCLRVNVARVEVIEFCSPEDLALFKLIWSKSERRILSIPEIIKAGISKWPIENFYNSDFEVIDNTEDELLEAIKEMQSRVSGNWTTSKEDLELQNRFRSCFEISDYNSRYETPICTYFLRKHEKELF